MATAGADAMIRFWDTTTAEPLGNPATGFTSWINHVAFSPNGKSIVSAADEGLQLWDVATGQPHGRPLSADARFFGVAFGPDGLTVIAADAGAVTLWDLHEEALVDAACRTANRELTTQEWQRFFGADVVYSPTCR